MTELLQASRKQKSNSYFLLQMPKMRAVWVTAIIGTIWQISLAGREAPPQDVRVQRFQSAPGIYYDNQGIVSLYSTTWRVVSYFNLKELHDKFEETQVVANRAVTHCMSRLNQAKLNTGECESTQQAVKWHVEKIFRSEEFIDQLARHEQPRVKRGILNFIGETSKVLFGTLDEDDAEFSKAKIDVLEEQQRELLRLSKEQVTIVRASLIGVNQTLNAVTKNTEIIAEGIRKLSRYVEDYENSTNRKVQHTLVLLTITDQIMQITSMFNELEREYDLLVSAIVNA